MIKILFATLAVTLALASAPFQNLSGNWSGGGQINYENGRDEQMRCKANYAADQNGNRLKLQLSCASQSYKVDARGEVVHSGGKITGSFHENTNNVDGVVTGSASGNTILVELNAKNFIFELRIATEGNCQDVNILPRSYSNNDIRFRMCKQK